MERTSARPSGRLPAAVSTDGLAADAARLITERGMGVRRARPAPAAGTWLPPGPIGQGRPVGTRNPAGHPAALAQAFAGAAAPPASPAHLVALFPRALPGCRAATAARWQEGRTAELAASDPGVAELLASQLERDAASAVEPVNATQVWCPDTQHECRWPGFRADALRLGIRSLVTLTRREGPDAVTVTLYGVRPGLPAVETATLAWLFASPGATRADVLLAARSSGSAWPQAVWLLMRALGTGKGEAQDLLRAIARSRHCGGEDAARRLVAEYARGARRICETAPAAENIPGHAREQSAKVATARQNSLRASQLARNFLDPAPGYQS